MAKETDQPVQQDNSPVIHVSRNGEIYVTPEDVVKSDKFKEQIERWQKSL